jgi:type VI secretion system FHA domain protein
MLVLTVTSFNGTPTHGPSAQFDELGGTVGRADTNQLVLPDPERSISRVHAQVLYRNGAFWLVDRGSNAVAVNGQMLGNGRESKLKDGDRIEIGGYVIEAAYGDPTQKLDPFDDLFGATTPGVHPLSAPPPPRAPIPDPLARPAAPPPPPRAPRAAGPSAIPDDWDPFAPDAATPASAPTADPFAALQATPLGGDLPVAPTRSEDSLDALFGLGGASASPTPLDPLGAVPSPPAVASDDPLLGLFAPPTPTPPTASDHASELQTPWEAAPLKAPRAPAPPPAAPKGAVFSWEQPSREGRVVTQPAMPPLGATPPVPVPAQPAPLPPAPRAAAPAPAAAAAGQSALLAAFAEGLGVGDAGFQQLGPDEMRLLGQLLREATQGTVELLLSRAALKREMRAEVTVIAARQNNPLKFSPTVEVALQYLLGTPKPGFMPPAPAMRDAFNDLRAHQLGMMAGMRSALEGVLKRFDPAVLESRIEKRSGLSAVLPGSRKARLWELFQELYGQLSAEAEDDFHQLFGKAFLAAYESYIEQLQSNA